MQTITQMTEREIAQHSRAEAEADAIRRLGATDGANGASWDPDVLREFAQSCLRGESIPAGGPEMQAEADRLEKEWAAIQRGE